MAKFRKKPVVVEATQFFENGSKVPGVRYGIIASGSNEFHFVTTIHGQRAVVVDGDWIITEPDGIHHYPCKPDIFEAAYEPV